MRVVLYLLIAFGLYTRLFELGYSNLQGDEVNPLDFIYGEKFWSYIFAQKRGPTQVLINWANTALLGYQNEFLIRLPFLIFALAALVTLYIFAKKLWGKKTALWTITLMAVNGLFIAFSRIAQYQAVIFFLLPLAGWLFIKRKIKDSPSKKDYPLFILSAVIYGLAILTHYDALTMLPFFIIVPLMHLIRKERTLKQTLKDGAVFFGIVAIPNLIFYTGLFLNPYFKESASGYLGRRLFGGGLMPRTASNMPILSLYVPKHYLLFLFSAVTLGLLRLKSEIRNSKLQINSKFQILNSKLPVTGYWLLITILFSATIFSLYPIKPRASSLLVIGSSVAIVGLLALSKKVTPAVAGTVAWFLFAYCTYYFIMRDPRTHVYTAFLPGFILAGYGIKSLLDSLKPKTVSYLAFGLLTLFLIFEAGLIYHMFVDKSPEYPWWDKSFLGRNIYHIEHALHKKVEGVFGIPYYRGWERLAEGFNQGCLTGSFYSNEKDSITYFYTRQHQVEKEVADLWVLVEGPHSWVFEGAGRPKEGYEIIKTIESKGIPVSYIYAPQNTYPNKEPLCNF